MRIGVDVGRVIMCPTKDDGSPDTSFLSANFHEAMSVKAADNCFEVLHQLVDKTHSQVYIVSKCGNRIQDLTRQWFDAVDFYYMTGVERNQIHFVYKREDKQIVARELQLTHFVDDRTDVLLSLHQKVPNLYLFGKQKDDYCPPWAKHVPDWNAVRKELL